VAAGAAGGERVFNGRLWLSELCEKRGENLQRSEHTDSEKKN
jgi:hypothetical protein